MKNVVSAMFVACALSAAVGVAAQGEPATPPQQPATGTQQPGTGRQPVPDTQTPAAPTEQRPAASQSAAKDTVTISGCIQNAPAQAAGGASSASGAGSKYVLANAKAGTGARSSAVGTAGNAATATRYRLDGEEKTISPHVNHQVEITGTVQPTSASATGAANASPGSAAAGPMLKVDSVKMVSATCQQP
jgi:hypothetical protein